MTFLTFVVVPAQQSSIITRAMESLILEVAARTLLKVTLSYPSRSGK